MKKYKLSHPAPPLGPSSQEEASWSGAGRSLSLHCPCRPLTGDGRRRPFTLIFVNSILASCSRRLFLNFVCGGLGNGRRQAHCGTIRNSQMVPWRDGPVARLDSASENISLFPPPCPAMTASLFAYLPPLSVTAAPSTFSQFDSLPLGCLSLSVSLLFYFFFVFLRVSEEHLEVMSGCLL